jgi:hypothetical protein
MVRRRRERPSAGGSRLDAGVKEEAAERVAAPVIPTPPLPRLYR